jgi:NAD(P)-dependent dehydrogenase (short-subunit alcohol dehydrogenase family)
MKDLQGKVALVTGAASGIGRALAEALGAQGMRIVIADIDADKLAETGEALARAGVTYFADELDIRDRAAWADLVAGAERELGPIQLLCNNAGVTATPAPLLDLDPEAWDWVLGTNLTGTYNGVAAVAGRLRRLDLPGHIVNTASIQGLIASPNFGPYNASKAGMIALSETMLVEFAELGIGVSVLCPGPTRGNIMASSQKIAPHLMPPRTGRPREGFTHYQTAEEVAAQVVDAVREGHFYIVTHPEYRPIIEARWAALSGSIAPMADADAVANTCRVEEAIFGQYRAIAEKRT